MEFTDVSRRLTEKQIEDVYALSVGSPTPEKLAALAAQYGSEPSWSAFALFESSIPVGVIGIELLSPECARIRHISVAAANQRLGIGRRLIEESRIRKELCEICAETDADAVPFYLRCGFVVTSLGELYPGVERFSCLWLAA